jgi:DNA-binding NarL/FixJ family response regulator
LTLQGFTVVGGASSGGQALNLVRALSPDVVLVDVELGDEDGIELAQRLTASGSSTVVILISGRDRDGLSELIAGSGALGFLRKDALDARAVVDLVAQQRGPKAGPRTPHGD